MNCPLLTLKGVCKIRGVMRLGGTFLIFAATVVQSVAAGLDFEVSFLVDGQVKTREFNTETGPADGKRLLTGIRLVPSGAENVYIGIDRSTVWRVTSSGATVNESAAKPELADWSMGVAYDSQENQVVLVTLGGEGFMYSRTPAGEWSTIKSMNNVDLESLVYNPTDNALYGIEVYGGSPDQPSKLLKFSPATGDKIGEIALPAFPVDMRPGGHTAELIAVEGKIVALLERDPQQIMAAGDHSRIYVIDPATGAAELTYDNEPGHEPTVSFVSPANGSSVKVNEAITLTIQASDPDNDLRFMILREEPAELKMWSLDPSPVGVFTATHTYTPRSVGTHTLEVAVNDLSGRIARATLTLVATNPPPPTGNDVKFVGVYFDTDRVIGVEYTEDGPVDGGTLYRGHHVAQAGYRYLGREGHTIFRWDNENENLVYTEPNYGDFSWPRGTAYDVKRNRFLVVTLVGEGELYSVNPETLQWSTIASMENVDVDSIVYHPADDHIYMVENHGDNVRILRYNAAGQQVGSFTIGNVPLPIGSSYSSRLISAGNKIALLIEPTIDWRPEPPVESRIYIIDPSAQTGTLTYRKVWTTWPPNQPPPNSAPVAEFKLPAGNTRVSLGDKVYIDAEVSDADNDLRAATLTFSGATVKTWTFENASGKQTLTFELTADQIGTHAISLRVTDGAGNVDEASVQITVTNAEVSFVGWYYDSGQAIGVDYMPKGPLEPGPLFRGLHLAKSNPYRYLGRDGHEIFLWDNETAVYTPTAPEGEFSWARGTAYDSERNRFVVVTLGGEGFLYSVDPTHLEWDIIASMENVDVDSIEYHAANDHFYMVENHGGTVRILRYNAEGKPDGESISIPNVPLDVGHSYQSRLISTGDKIALLIEPTANWPLTPPVESRIYMIDPVAKTAELTYRKIWQTWPPHQPPPNTAPVVQIILPAGAITVSPGERVNILAEVSDTENNLRTATLLLGGTTLKTWTFENATGTQTLTYDFTAEQLGVRPIYLRATDAAGNNTEASVQLTVSDNGGVSFVGWYYENEGVVGVDYTEKGPVDGGTLYRGLPVAQAGYRYLGRDGHTIFRYDNERDTYTETLPSGDFSWPRGTTWDHRRNRFLVVTLGGEGFLYAVDPVTLAWSTVASMDNVDVDSIVYHHVDDRLYMVENHGGTVRVLRYNAEGDRLGEAVIIPDVPLAIGSYYQSRLISAGDKLALLIEPTPGWRPNPPVESRIYIINPITGSSELTYRKIWDTWPPQPTPPPPPPPIVTVQRDLPASYAPGVVLTVRLELKPTAGVIAWALEEQAPAGWIFGSASDSGVIDRVTGKIKWGPFTDVQVRTLTYTIRPNAASTGPKTFSGVVSFNGNSTPITGDTTISDAPQHHPADAPPQDFRITMDELTAYAAAWKTGASWPRGPSPIPISYVTRAGQIWKSGESYQYVGTIAPPGCWVPVNQYLRTAPLAAAALPSASEIIRTLPPAFTPGRLTTVSVTVRPAAGVNAYAIEDRPPIGWTIASANGAAIANGAVRYGPFFDSLARTFTYQVVPTATASADFSGAGSFDGSDDPVKGACAVSQPGCTAEHRDGRVYLSVNATPGEQFVLESATSVDSSTWTFEANIEGTQTAVELPAIEPSAASKFYRLRPVAP